MIASDLLNTDLCSCQIRARVRFDLKFGLCLLHSLIRFCFDYLHLVSTFTLFSLVCNPNL